MRRLLVILGMPGSGKDTQIESLQNRKPIEVIKVGDLVREKAKSDPSVAEDLKKGDLADDSLVNELITEKIQKSSADAYIISDGFPRNVDQAEWLYDQFAKYDIYFEGALLLRIDDSEALKRLLKRGREDDIEATIKHRLEIFHTLTDPVAEFFKSRAKLVEIDGMGTPEEVVENIRRALGW